MKKSVCLYFQVHQPTRLRLYRFFDIGKDSHYYDDYANRTILRRIAQKCYLPMNELVDVEKERERLRKELEKNRGFLENQRRKLANENFVSRAPEHVVNAERERAEKLQALIANLEESLRKLG